MADEPIALRGMGSFYVGGRTVEVSGEPIRDLVLSPGGVPLRLQTSVVDLSAVIHRITTERWAGGCSRSVGSPNRQSHSPHPRRHSAERARRRRVVAVSTMPRRRARRQESWMWLIRPDVGSAVNSRMPTADTIMARANLMEK